MAIIFLMKGFCCYLDIFFTNYCLKFIDFSSIAFAKTLHKNWCKNFAFNDCLNLINFSKICFMIDKILNILKRKLKPFFVKLWYKFSIFAKRFFWLYNIIQVKKPLDNFTTHLIFFANYQHQNKRIIIKASFYLIFECLSCSETCSWGYLSQIMKVKDYWVFSFKN